jgi:hypothetical protein
MIHNWETADAQKLREIWPKVENELLRNMPHPSNSTSLEAMALSAAEIKGFRLGLDILGGLASFVSSMAVNPGFENVTTFEKTKLEA